MPAAPNEKPRAPRGKSVLALLRQGLTKQPEGKDWGQDELLDTLHWLRQLTSLFCGIIWGVIPLKGLIGFVTYLVVLYGSVVVWLNVQSIDAEDYGGTQLLHMEGWPPAIGIFLLSWITTFTVLHS